MKIDLSGIWSMTDAEHTIQLNTQLPCDNYTSLLQAKEIPDPFYGKNEKEVQWVAYKDWAWSKTFTITDEFLDSHEQIYLHLSEVDTFAKIFINQQLITTSENMFVPVKSEVKKFLKLGKNLITIEIRSPIKEANDLAKKQPFFIPYSGNNSVPHMNLIRKTQCHAGWDWGISLIASGVYGSLELIAYKNCVLENIYTTQQHEKKDCELSVFVELTAFHSGSQTFLFSIDNATFSREVTLVKGKNKFSVAFIIEDAQLWYPAGYGKQPLYEVAVSTGEQKIQKKIGLRKLEIINEKDSIGKSLVFRVNGIDIFCKGANWIPSDAFPSRQTKEKAQSLLLAAKEANMNMIRVWGGGQYEKNFFYELCDELGLLVWQDLMFSCSLYPSTKEFIANVKKELTYQAMRLRDYACIALWCGDNEVIGALDWYKESKANRDTYLVNYDRLNRACQEVIEETDPTRVFWPSSPCAGPNDFSNNWHNDGNGDMHFWSVWGGGKPFEAYYTVKPRFCSEFGYQSFPSLETINSFCEKAEQNVTSPIMEAHQKNDSGNQLIVNMFSRYFRMPNSFENFVYLSQVQQAIAIKTAVEFWRHLMPNCMGTLYWQLNDLWPVASWSSVEYNGNWKQLHYHAKRFYAPLLVTGFKLSDGPEIWLINDFLKSITPLVYITIYDFKGKILEQSSHPYQIKKQSTKKIKHWKWADFKRPLEEFFIVTSAFYRDETNTLRTIDNTLFLSEYKKCNLQEARINFTCMQKSKFSIEVKFTTNVPAFFVNLETKGLKGIFDDNSFTLLPNKKKTVLFRADKELNLSKFESALSIQHLRASY